MWAFSLKCVIDLRALNRVKMFCVCRYYSLLVSAHQLPISLAEQGNTQNGQRKRPFSKPMLQFGLENTKHVCTKFFVSVGVGSRLRNKSKSFTFKFNQVNSRLFRTYILIHTDTG